ncbi:MAG: DUF2442 domain-containing protein [Chloroflexi bacterium]|nr:DUF2442 domain-containing protein [Chloroflexota bacterium]
MENMIISRYPDTIDVRAVEPLTHFFARVTFSDGSQRVINLEPYLEGPIFAPIRNNPEMFRRIFVDHGAVAWPNGADIDTDTLYYDGPPPWAETTRARANPKGL